MIVLHNILYRNGPCRILYSNDGGKTWCLDTACRVAAKPEYIRSL